MTPFEVKRGDIYLADLGQSIGREYRGIRPVVIIQSNTGNQYSPTTIVAMISTYNNEGKPKLPTHVIIMAGEAGIQRDSIVVTEQLRTIDKSRLMEYVGTLDSMKNVNKAILISLGMAKERII